MTTLRSSIAMVDSAVLAPLERRSDPRLLVGRETFDDAGVFQISEDLALVQRLIARHVQHTGSQLGQRVLQDWDENARRFIKIMPRDYKRVLQAEARAAAAGRSASFTELVGAGVSG